METSQDSSGVRLRGPLMEGQKGMAKENWGIVSRKNNQETLFHILASRLHRANPSDRRGHFLFNLPSRLHHSGKVQATFNDNNYVK